MGGLALIRLLLAIASLGLCAQPALALDPRPPGSVLVEVEVLGYRSMGSPPVRPDEITSSVYTRLDLRVVRGISGPTRLRRLTVTLLMSNLPQSNRLVLLLRNDRASSPEVLSWAYVRDYTCLHRETVEQYDLEGLLLAQNEEESAGPMICGFF